MKKSTMVTLVLSGALMSGCDDRNRAVFPPNDAGETAEAEPTNNTYVPGQGYYHAPYHGWYKYPFNYYQPGYGYYHGGLFTPDPMIYDIISSRPSRPSTFRVGSVSGGGFTHIGSISSASSVSRGGFGSTAHSASIGS
jgi:hypothetical protein